MKIAKTSWVALCCCLAFGIVSQAPVTLASAQQVEEKKQEDKKDGQDLKALGKMMVGTWIADLEKSVKAAEDADEDAEQVEQMLAEDMSVEFGKEGEMLVSMRGQELDGEYTVEKLDKENKKTFYINVTMVTPGGDQEMEMEVKVLGKNAIRVRPNDGNSPAIVFVREKEDKKDKKDKDK